MSFNFNMEEKKSVTTETIDTKAITESYTSESRALGGVEGVFSPLAPIFHARGANEFMNLLAQQEPKHGDVAPSTAEIDNELLMNLHINSSDMLFDDVDNSSNFFGGGPRPESITSTNVWGDTSASTADIRNGEMIDTFDFLVKSLSSANNYVSMLTREQLSVLRSIRPSLLYEFLQEVAKVRTEKRMRRAAPNECAFCKNNGENEDCYSSHALKDWRGRVLCPVLRAFRCPRCGATGDRAHTIKYCPENGDNGLDRSSSFATRRRLASSTSLLFGAGAPPPPAAPAPSPAPAAANFTNTSLWNAFGLN